MKRIKESDLKKRIYDKHISNGYNKTKKKHKIWKIRKQKPNDLYGIIIPKEEVEKFNLNGVYYNIEFELSGEVIILKSGTELRIGERK